MTLQNMAAWCALHDRVLVISWKVKNGELHPVCTATMSGERDLRHSIWNATPHAGALNG
jgi:hypothetical protein